MKTIYKIMIAFLAICMITPAMGYEIYEQPDDQPAIWWDEDPSYNEWIHHRTIFGDVSLDNVAFAHPAPLDDLRAGYFHSGDFPRAQTDDFGYLHSGAKSDNPDPQKYF